jgi:hypothetical protein
MCPPSAIGNQQKKEKVFSAIHLFSFFLQHPIWAV